jgi:trk system potassium uptake protein TrkA
VRKRHNRTDDQGLVAYVGEEYMRVIIVGAGRVGARLANLLDPKHDVTIVDVNAAAFRRLSPNFAGRLLEGNGIDIDVLREAGTEQADVFIAVTDSDNCNLMAAQIAKTIFGVERVVARVYDPERAMIFEEHGLRTVSPTVISAERLFDRIVSSPVAS